MDTKNSTPADAPAREAGHTREVWPLKIVDQLDEGGEPFTRIRFAVVESVMVEWNGQRIRADRIVGGLLFESKAEADFINDNLPHGVAPPQVG